MYKYIVYCSVSAAIIILSKYLYQHWIKQNHIISKLKQEMSILSEKVKRMECDMEKNNHIFSGGVKIPITFSAPSPSPSPSPSPLRPSSPLRPQPQPQPETIILLKEDISATSVSSSSASSSVPSVKSVKSVKSAKSLDICDDEKPPAAPLPEPEPEPEPQPHTHTQTQTQINNEEEASAATSAANSVATSVATNDRERRKKKLPDAKQYSNGSKFKDEENNCEYLCVVGKRGGHSWKKI